MTGHTAGRQDGPVLRHKEAMNPTLIRLRVYCAGHYRATLMTTMGKEKWERGGWVDRLDAEAAAAAAARCACHVSGIKMARTTARGALDQAQLPPRQPCLRPAVTYSKCERANPAGPACHKLFSGVRPDRDAKLSLSLSRW